MIKLEDAVKTYLKRRGWSTWYNPNAWVHPKIVADLKSQDYTEYAMDLTSAFIHEAEDMPSFRVPSAFRQTTHDPGSEAFKVLKEYFGSEN